MVLDMATETACLCPCPSVTFRYCFSAQCPNASFIGLQLGQAIVLGFLYVEAIQMASSTGVKVRNPDPARGLDITKDTRGPNKPATNISWKEAARFVN